MSLKFEMFLMIFPRDVSCLAMMFCRIVTGSLDGKVLKSVTLHFHICIRFSFNFHSTCGAFSYSYFESSNYFHFYSPISLSLIFLSLHCPLFSF